MFQKVVCIAVSICFFLFAHPVSIAEQSKNGLHTDKSENVLQFARECLTERFDLKEIQLDSMEFTWDVFPTKEMDEICVVEYYPNEREKYVVEFRHPSYELELCALYIDGMMKYTPRTFVLGSSFPSSSQNTVSCILAYSIAWDHMKLFYNFSETTYPMFTFGALENKDDGTFCVEITPLYDKQFHCGTYTFLIDAKDGKVLSHDWDMEAQYHEQNENGVTSKESIWSSKECNEYAANRYEK